MLDLMWVIGSLFVVIVWIFLYLQTRKKIFIGIAIITLVADFFVLKEMGITLKSLMNTLI